MHSTKKILALLLSGVIFIASCSKDDNGDDGPAPEPAPTTRILTASLETSGTGIPLLDLDYVFVYADDNNQLEGIGEVNPDGSIRSVWVFLYDAAGKPESATRVGSDLATIIQTIPLTYSGNQLTSVNGRRITIENNRIVGFDSTRVSYTSGGDLDKVFRLTTAGTETQVGQITTSSTLRYPWARLLPRIELQAVIPFVVPTVSIFEGISRNAIITNIGVASNGTAVDIRYTYTGSENNFVTNTSRTVSVPGNQRILNFTYEPIPR
jgi:hypothetical protein